MKKKIGEIYNKPIVEGDKNLVTKNEIHKSGLSGGSGSGGEGNIEYVSLQDVNFASTEARTALIKMSYAFKYLYKYNGSKNIVFTAMYNKPENATVYAVAIDFSFKIGDKSLMSSTKEYFAQLGVDTDTLHRITKEEFYSLD